MNDGNKKIKKEKETSNIKWSKAIRWKAILFLYLPCIVVFQISFYFAVDDLRKSWEKIEKGREFKKEYYEERSRLFTILGKHDRANTEDSSGTGMMFLVRDSETGRTAVIDNLRAETFMSYDKGDKVRFIVKKEILYNQEELNKINGGYKNEAITTCSVIMVVALLFMGMIGYGFTDMYGLVSSSKEYKTWISFDINSEESKLLDKVNIITTIIAYLIPNLQLLGIWISTLAYVISVE